MSQPRRSLVSPSYRTKGTDAQRASNTERKSTASHASIIRHPASSPRKATEVQAKVEFSFRSVRSIIIPPTKASTKADLECELVSPSMKSPRSQGSSTSLSSLLRRSYSPRTFRVRTCRLMHVWLTRAQEELDALDSELAQSTANLEKLAHVEARALDDIHAYLDRVERSTRAAYDLCVPHASHSLDSSNVLPASRVVHAQQATPYRSRLQKSRLEAQRDFARLVQSLDQALKELKQDERSPNASVLHGTCENLRKSPSFFEEDEDAL